LGGPWTVRFTPGWGAPEQVTWKALKSWTRDEDPGIRYYSGTARYETELRIPKRWLQEERQLFLDLGQLSVVGEVVLNGEDLGIVWKPPYRLDISQAARPGLNRLQVVVANTWSNRLVGDALDPEGRRYCRTNISGSGTPFQAWKDVPLRESGLLGPVRLIPAIEQTLDCP
jgi:hypothetical protein